MLEICVSSEKITCLSFFDFTVFHFDLENAIGTVIHKNNLSTFNP